MGMCGGAPDYTPVAAASAESAQLGKELGEDQLTEARRQFDINTGIIGPIVKAQTDIMNEQLAQGRDSYAYAKSFRPLEQDMLGVASNWRDQLTTKRAENDAIANTALGNADTLTKLTGWYQDQQLDALKTMTGGNSAITDKYGADIENDVGTAVADARAGQTQAMNSAIRQALRYGLSVPAVGSQVGMSSASAQAAAANNARTSSIDKYRNLVAQGFQARDQGFRTSQTALSEAMGKQEGAMSTRRANNIQDEAIAWGRGMDMAGLGRGMVGASQGSYSLATQAGSAAAQSQMAPSSQLMQGLQFGNNMIMQGQQQKINGLSAALGSQGGGDGTLQAIGALGSIASMFAWSDRRLKRDIRRVGTTPGGHALYAFRYLWGSDVHVGVMADEVAGVPGAVRRIGGFAAVDYACLH